MTVGEGLVVTLVRKQQETEINCKLHSMCAEWVKSFRAGGILELQSGVLVYSGLWGKRKGGI